MVQPRVLRPVPDPLGGYLRPGSHGHKVLLQMLVEGHPIGTGLVADPCHVDRQHDLMEEARRCGVETVLDPRTGHYLENLLRPASDRALRAAAADITLTTARLRLDSWRGTLGADLETHSNFTISPPAAGKRLPRAA